MRAWTLIAIACALFFAPSLPAQVKVKKGDDGRLVISNSGTRRPARRSYSAPATKRALVAPGDLDPIVRRFAAESSVDPKLVHAVIRVESAYDQMARSHKGAMGLMQLMPATAAALDVSDPYDVQQNVRGGVTYLGRMLERFDGRVEWALAGYNAGPEAVVRYDGIPPYAETVNYVEKVLRIYRGDPAFALPASNSARRGRKTYLVRGPDNRLVLTTTPPSTR